MAGTAQEGPAFLPGGAAVEQAAAQRLDPDDPDKVNYKTLVVQREFPTQSSCDEPAMGWIGLVETGGSERRVTFDGGPPSWRTPRPNRVPDLGDTLVFSARWPANFFSQSVPCYVSDTTACAMNRAAGAFVVVQRVRYNAGPRGASRWQLCLVREKEIRI